MVGKVQFIENKVFLPDFNSLVIYVPMNIVFTPSQVDSILVKCNEDILKNLNFNYDNGKLNISGRKDLCLK